MQVHRAASKTASPFTDEDLERFRRIIIEKRQKAMEDIDWMKAQLADAREQASNESAYSLHMADATSDMMELEKLYLMMARQQKYVGYLNRALDRAREDICDNHVLRYAEAPSYSRTLLVFVGAEIQLTGGRHGSDYLPGRPRPSLPGRC